MSKFPIHLNPSNNNCEMYMVALILHHAGKGAAGLSAKDSSLLGHLS